MRSIVSSKSSVWQGLITGSLLIVSQLTQAAELPDFTQLVEQNGPAVVNISTRSHQGSGHTPRMEIPDFPEGSPFGDLFRHFFGAPDDGQGGGNGGATPHPEARSLGSGVIIDSHGYIITNNHVIDGADEISVRLGDRRELQAEVIGSDERSDIALLKIQADDLPTATIGHSEALKVGEWVMAIGSPFGFDRSVSVGVVSALGRSLPNENYVPFIQTDVAINPGNSGGPLFNLKGEVVGINSQIYSRTGGYMGLSFAIPIDMAMEVVDQLKAKGRVSRGWLGVLIQDVTAELADSFGLDKPKGALVAQVLPDSPAAAAGFQVGDVILALDGQPIEHSAALPPLVGRLAPESVAHFLLLRSGTEMSLDVTIGELPVEEGQAIKSEQPSKASVGKLERLGISARDLDAAQRKQLGLTQGVFVSAVGEGPAAAAGVQRGDVILRLGNQDVNDMASLEQLVQTLPAGRALPLLVQRGEGPLFLALRLPKGE